MLAKASIDMQRVWRGCADRKRARWVRMEREGRRRLARLREERKAEQERFRAREEEKKAFEDRYSRV